MSNPPDSAMPEASTSTAPMQEVEKAVLPPINSPELDMLQLAKTTKKVLGRLAPFCQMTEIEEPSQPNAPSSAPSAGGPVIPSTFSSPAVTPSPSVGGATSQTDGHPTATANPSAPHTSQAKVVSKVRQKVAKLITSIDVHIQAAQVGFKLAREGMMLCDGDVRGFKKSASSQSSSSSDTTSSSSTTSSSETGRQRPPQPGLLQAGKKDGDDEGWEVDMDRSPVEAEEVRQRRSDTRSLRQYAKQGLELVERTKEGFNEIRQEVYKIAAQTKDSTQMVFVPPEPGQPASLRKPLKEVGLDLVANLNLLSEFVTTIGETATWWAWVLEDLSKGDDSSVLSPPVPSPKEAADKGSEGEKLQRAYDWWAKAKEGWQGYYDIINALHSRYPDLLPLSAAAWEGTTIVLHEHLGGLSATTSISGGHHATSGKNEATAKTLTGFLSWNRGKDSAKTKQAGRRWPSWRRKSLVRSQSPAPPPAGEAADELVTTRGSLDQNVSGQRNLEGERREEGIANRAHLFKDGLKHLGCHGCVVI